MRRKIKFYLLFTSIILIFTACTEHEVEDQKNSTLPHGQSSKAVDQLVNQVVKDVLVNTPEPKESPESPTLTFTFRNLKNQSSPLEIKDDIYTFKNIKQPIVMVVLASTWCPPCRGQVPHLSNLQKRFKENLFIMGALIHDDIKDRELQKLMISEKVNFYVSSDQKENLKFSNTISKKLGLVNRFTLPLIVIFSNGNYFTHYEGSMPEEMIESDIKQLLEKLKKKQK